MVGHFVVTLLVLGLVSRVEPEEGTGSSNQALRTLLEEVVSVSTCFSGTISQPFPVDINISAFDPDIQRAELAGRVITELTSSENNDHGAVRSLLKSAVTLSGALHSARLALKPNVFLNPHLSRLKLITCSRDDNEVITETYFDMDAEDQLPWLQTGNEVYEHTRHNTSAKLTGLIVYKGKWSMPYYMCDQKKWIIAYVIPLIDDVRLNGFYVIEGDVTSWSINQCNLNDTSTDITNVINTFAGTNKCHRTTHCEFTPNQGWVTGAYTCHCKTGFYSTIFADGYNGSEVENTVSSSEFEEKYSCLKCQDGCETCVDGSQCMSGYSWPFRLVLLSITMLCVLLALILCGFVYKYRKQKVVSVASPTFLIITLIGCVIMYCEMLAQFPILTTMLCCSVKWTRHLGFGVTYSALLLKTWRVSLTYRVKSAHKLKLTDKQLLRWLLPILLLIVTYLAAWTVSSPPGTVRMMDVDNLWFLQCEYDWWDHCLVIGEVLFLIWGIRICYVVRNAVTLFNEAKFISYAIYNIAFVNAVMLLIHLVIYPNAPPDIKYLFSFLRVILCTTVTIVLVFGIKVQRIVQGKGDVYDIKNRRRANVSASLSVNGVNGLINEETIDLYQENEELKVSDHVQVAIWCPEMQYCQDDSVDLAQENETLKEEIQRLYAQIEVMKTMSMEIGNRHLKPKHTLNISHMNAASGIHSPLSRDLLVPSVEFSSVTSPAAELESDRV